MKTFTKKIAPFGIATLLILSGCKTKQTFDASNFHRFADPNGHSVVVIYGNKIPNASAPTYDKIRVHLPNGKTVFMTPSIASTGSRYLTDDGRYAFHENGNHATLIDKGNIIFEGALSSQQTP